MAEASLRVIYACLEIKDLPCFEINSTLYGIKNRTIGKKL